ncbi:MAG TPA: flagellar biosynthetic protein FliR, partial [Salinarimonas sp.]|nr:flagellar biosynthetic protein FliR [Salinarimonas sp.]
PDIAAAFILTFARVGTLVMLMPGIGERLVSARARLSLALALTLLLYPVARPLLPLAGGPGGAFATLIGEIAVGLVLGLSVRMVIAALQTAGTIVAQEMGLGFAVTVDPSMGGQQPSIANFLNLLGLTLVFASDLHHLAIGAVRASYTLLPPAGMPEAADAAKLAIRAVGHGFSLAVQISAPFIVFGVLVNVGLGVLARLIPQFQIFFIAMPATILGGMLVMMAVLAVMMGVFIEALGAHLAQLSGR